jgi:hypothetical protein
MEAAWRFDTLNLIHVSFDCRYGLGYKINQVEAGVKEYIFSAFCIDLIPVTASR